MNRMYQDEDVIESVHNQIPPENTTEKRTTAVTADKEIWAATGLDIALSCLERVQPTLIRTAELFREDTRRANAFLIHCIDGLERFLEAMTITKSAMSLDLATVPTDIGTLAQTESELAQILKEMLGLQEKEAFELLADKLEYELITNLHIWVKTLRRLTVSEERS